MDSVASQMLSDPNILRFQVTVTYGHWTRTLGGGEGTVWLGSLAAPVRPGADALLFAGKTLRPEGSAPAWGGRTVVFDWVLGNASLFLKKRDRHFRTPRKIGPKGFLPFFTLSSASGRQD